MDNLDSVDKKIISLLNEGKEPKDIAKILNEQGFRTVKGDIFLRKTVNNKITGYKLKGLLSNKSARKKTQVNTLVKPNLYKTELGKFRIRLNVKGKNVHETFDTQEEAEKRLTLLNKNWSDKKVRGKNKIKPEPKLSKVSLKDLLPPDNSPKKVNNLNTVNKKSDSKYLIVIGSDISELNISDLLSNF